MLEKQVFFCYSFNLINTIKTYISKNILPHLPPFYHHFYHHLNVWYTRCYMV